MTELEKELNNILTREQEESATETADSAAKDSKASSADSISEEAFADIGKALEAVLAETTQTGTTQAEAVGARTKGKAKEIAASSEEKTEKKKQTDAGERENNGASASGSRDYVAGSSPSVDLMGVIRQIRNTGGEQADRMPAGRTKRKKTEDDESASISSGLQKKQVFHETDSEADDGTDTFFLRKGGVENDSANAARQKEGSSADAAAQKEDSSVRKASPDIEDAEDAVAARLVEELEIAETEEKNGSRKKKGSRRRMSGLRKASIRIPAKRQRKPFHWSDLTGNLRRFWNRTWGRVICIAALVLLAGLAVMLFLRFRTYGSVTVLLSDETENTASFTYYNFNGEILKCGIDSAILVDTDNHQKWNVSYSMQDPRVITNGAVAAIYDRHGTSVCVCNEDGQMGTITANMPITKAAVSENGNVAVILEESNDVWIQYYAVDGSLISTIKTVADNPGYPMSIALSDDGLLLEVSYLYMDGVTPCTRIYDYNFGSVGQNQMDNLVSSFEYRDTIVPECAELGGAAFLAMRDDGFSLYGESQIPDETVNVTIEETILSAFHNDDYIGMVVENDPDVVSSESSKSILLYNRNGHRVAEIETDYDYEDIVMYDDFVVMTSRMGCCIYSAAGVKKYEAQYDAAAQQIFPIGKTTLVYITEDAMNILKLK